MTDTIIGDYLVIQEPNGTANVYAEEGNGEHVHHAGSMREARAWVYAQLGEDDPEAEEDEPARAQQRKPCKQCPWRRMSMPGWLGASPPEGFVATMLLDVEPMPCHSTINYNRPDWHRRWLAGTDKRAKLCAGAKIAAANMGKQLRGGSPVQADRETVFASFAEFIEHHRKLPRGSWAEPSPGTLEHASINNVRRHVGLPLLCGRG